MEGGAIQHLVSILKHGSETGKQRASGFLGNLASNGNDAIKVLF